MSRFFHLLLLCLLPAGLACQSREDRRANIIGHNYIATEKYGTMLPAVSQVDLFAFGEGSPSEAERFKLAYDAKESFGVTNHVALHGEAAARFGSLWRSQRFNWGGSCFEPGFGIRFKTEGGLIFETAVCLTCHDFTAPVKGRRALLGFSGSHTNFLILSNTLTQAFTLR